MTTDTRNISDFVLGCIAADEAAARLCAEMFPPPWEVADRGWRVRIYSANVPDIGDHAEPGDERTPCVMEVEPTRRVDLEDSRWLSERVAHVVRQDPAHVLAVCAAHRAIVELHQVTQDSYDHEDCCVVCSAYGEYPDNGVSGDVAWPCDTLRALALAYADRPGFREEWRAEG